MGWVLEQECISILIEQALFGLREKLRGGRGRSFFFAVVIVRPWTINVEMLAMCQIKLDVR